MFVMPILALYHKALIGGVYYQALTFQADLTSPHGNNGGTMVTVLGFFVISLTEEC